MGSGPGRSPAARRFPGQNLGVWEAGEVAEVVIPANLAATVVAVGGRRRARLAGSPPDGWSARWPRRGTWRSAAPFEPGGNISWVAPARRRVDGVDAVLKLQHPHPESDPRPRGWRRGAVTEPCGCSPTTPSDERCSSSAAGRGTPLSGEPDPLAAARVGAGHRRPTARRAAAAAGSPPWPPCKAAWADELEGAARRCTRSPTRGSPPTRWRSCGHGPRRAGRQVLLHGDLNPTNVLAAEREPWLAIDPKPMVGDAAYDGSRLVAQPDPLVHADPADGRGPAARSPGRGPRCRPGSAGRVVPRGAVEMGVSVQSARRRRRGRGAVPPATPSCSRPTCHDHRACARPGRAVRRSRARAASAGAPRRAAPGAHRRARRPHARSRRRWSACWRPAAAWRALLLGDPGALARRSAGGVARAAPGRRGRRAGHLEATGAAAHRRPRPGGHRAAWRS